MWPSLAVSLRLYLKCHKSKVQALESTWIDPEGQVD